MALWSVGLIDPVDTLTNSHACWSSDRPGTSRVYSALCTADLNPWHCGARGCHGMFSMLQTEVKSYDCYFRNDVTTSCLCPYMDSCPNTHTHTHTNTCTHTRWVIDIDECMHGQTYCYPIAQVILTLCLVNVHAA